MKKKYSLIIVFTCLILIFNVNRINAQVNDNPCGAISLTVGATCNIEVGSNVGATNSAVPDVACDGGSSEGDVWFKAVIPASGSLTIETTPGTLIDIGMAIYVGTCSSLSLNSCVAGGNASYPAMPYKTVNGLIPGDTIWIRAWDVNNDQSGTFNICAVTCNVSVSISGSSTGCTAQPTPLCATAGFSSYSWTNSVTTACINVVSTAVYTVQATDANGCIATNSISFTAYTSPTDTITGPSVACSANNAELCIASGFTSYNWSNGGTNSCTIPVTTGSYTVVITDSHGCTNADSHTITVNTSPSVSITGPPSKCSNGTEQLCVPPTFSSYSWSNGGIAQCISPSTSGNYTVVVSDANNCTASSSQAITIHNAPATSITGPSAICSNSIPQLCVGGGFSSYAWSNGGTTNCISPPSTSTYTITVTDAFGCTGTDSKAITIYTAPSVTITGPSSACGGTPVQLCVPAGFTAYNWSNGGVGACSSPGASGNYTVIVTDANGCTATDNHPFTFDSVPISNINGPTITCNGSPGQLCAPAGGSAYIWSNGNTNSCITTTISATYTVTVTAANACTSTSSQSLNVVAPYAMTISGPATACSGSNPQLCATAGSYTYQWSNGATTACISPSVSGTYTVISTNPFGCTKSYTKGLTVYSPLNATISGPSSACIGSIIPLCATSGANSYLWSTGATVDCIDVNSNGIYEVTISDGNGCTASVSLPVTFSTTFNVDITGPISGCNGSSSTLCVPSGYTNYAWNTGETSECITVNNPGSYSVTIHDPVGCVANSFYNLTYNPPPIVNITGETNICLGTTSNWCATPGYVTYSWSNGGTAECINVSVDAMYTVEITDTNNCSASASAVLGIIHISPVINLVNNELICDTFNTAFTYSWLINGTPNGCLSDTCIPTFSATYTVIVTDTGTGCSESATYNYIVNGISKNDFGNDVNFYPNPFSGGEFNVDFNNMISEKALLVVYNSIGSVIYNSEINISSDHFSMPVRLPLSAAGIYFVTVQTGKGMLKRMVIEN